MSERLARQLESLLIFDWSFVELDHINFPS